MSIARESSDINRLRRRLQKHVEEQNNKYSVPAMIRSSELIKKQLKRDKSRIELQDKTIVLFDHNQHPAKEQKATVRIKKMVIDTYFKKGSFRPKT